MDIATLWQSGAIYLGTFADCFDGNVDTRWGPYSVETGSGGVGFASFPRPLSISKVTITSADWFGSSITVPYSATIFGSNDRGVTKDTIFDLVIPVENRNPLRTSTFTFPRSATYSTIGIHNIRSGVWDNVPFIADMEFFTEDNIEELRLPLSAPFSGWGLPI